MRFRAAAAAALMVIAIGCDRETQEDGFLTRAQAKPTETAQHPASAGGTAVVPDTTAGTTVIVTLEDRRIAVANPDAIPPGAAVFTINNTGSEVHNLFVEGPGISKAAGDSIAQGQTVPMELTLQPGTYTLYCPVLNHRELGEEVRLIIKPPAAPPPSSTVVPGTTAQ